MSTRQLTQDHLASYAGYLRSEERSPGTVEKYARDAEAFARWLAGGPVTREQAAAWREHLASAGYAPATVNSMLAALNGLLRFLGREDCRVKFLKMQRRLFRDRCRELTRPEYDRLLEAAHAGGQERLALLRCGGGYQRPPVQEDLLRRGLDEARLTDCVSWQGYPQGIALGIFPFHPTLPRIRPAENMVRFSQKLLTLPPCLV